MSAGGFGPGGGGFGGGIPPGGPPGGPPGAPPHGGGGAFGPPPGAPPPAGGGPFGAPPSGALYGPPPAGGAFGSPASGGAFGAPLGGVGAFGGTMDRGDPNACQGTVGEMFSNFGLLAKRSLSGIAWVYLMLAILFFCVITLPQSLATALRMEALTSNAPMIDLGVANILGYLTSALAVIVGLVIATLQAGLARAARVALVNPTFLGGFGGALRASYARFLPVLGCLLLFAIGIFVGLMLCLIPGPVVTFLGMAGTYLCASKDEGAWDSLIHSGRLTSRYIGPCAVLAVVAIVTLVVMLGINFGLALLLTSSIGFWGTMVSTVVVSLLAIPVGLIMWLFCMATFATIEMAESKMAICK